MRARDPRWRRPPCNDAEPIEQHATLEFYALLLHSRSRSERQTRLHPRGFQRPARQPAAQEITSDKRIKASLPTIQYALEHGAGVILASHLGRPKGKPNPEMSLKPVAQRLEELLGKPVKMAPDCIGPEVEAMLPKPGEVLLLENLRYPRRGRKERSRVFAKSSPRSATSTSTTRSAPRIAPTPPPSA